MLVWGKFILLLVLIYIFGTRASKSADNIAEIKGLAKAFMGVVMISAVTSFPELFTGISAVTAVKSTDIAMGEILGSCIFNIMIIALVELIFRKRNLYKLTGKINILPMGFSIIMITLLTLGVSGVFKMKFFNIGLMSFIIFGLYFAFMWIIFKERKQVEEPSESEEVKEVEVEEKGVKGNFSKEVILFILSSIIIIAVGWYLPYVGKELAVSMNWNDSFVGVIFLAFVTSFPELVVSIAAVRIGAVEMFIGNIAGSNLFNVAIIFIIDLALRGGTIFENISPGNQTVGIIAILMSFIVFFALVRHSSQKIFNFISINAIIIILLYIINLVVIFDF